MAFSFREPAPVCQSDLVLGEPSLFSSGEVGESRCKWQCPHLVLKTQAPGTSCVCSSECQPRSALLLAQPRTAQRSWGIAREKDGGMHLGFAHPIRACAFGLSSWQAAGATANLQFSSSLGRDRPHFPLDGAVVDVPGRAGGGIHGSAAISLLPNQFSWLVLTFPE